MRRGILFVPGAVLKIVVWGMVLVLLGSLVACATGEQITGGGKADIGDITWNISQYEGKSVTVSGEYRGWEAGHGSPPVTRSDWIIKDETGSIYVSGTASPGLDPVDDKGKKITVRGVVKVRDGQAYIEAEIINKP